MNSLAKKVQEMFFGKIKPYHIVGWGLFLFLIISGTVLANPIIKGYIETDEIKRWSEEDKSVRFERTSTKRSLVDLQELEEEAGFKILEPAYLPSNCQLSERYYFPLGREVHLNYQCDRYTAFGLAQKKGQTIKLPHIGEGSSETVDVNGQQAIYVDGGWLIGPDEDEAKWVPGLNQQLFMETNGIIVRVIASGMNKEKLLQITNSLE